VVRLSVGAVALACVLVTLPLSACVTGDVPPRPLVAPSCADAGAPVQLASAPGCGSLNLVVAKDTVYWTEKANGTLKSIPTCGGAITTIATAQPSPGPLAVDAASIFWVNSQRTIMKKALAGGNPTSFVAATTETEKTGFENEIDALLVDHGILFFGHSSSAMKVPTDGSAAPKTIGFSPVTYRGRPGAFAIDETHLYQTEIDHVSISREALDGNQNGLVVDGMGTRQSLLVDRIAVSQTFLVVDAIDVVNGQVIWAKSNLIYAKPVGKLEGDSFLPIARTSTATSVTGFVVSEDTIYLGQNDDIQKVPLSVALPPDADAGVPEPAVIASDQPAPSQFAADAVNIYWRTADCKIMKLTK
jgi:hypothetical protein